MTAELDVVGIGNALVDVISHESEEFLSEFDLTKGAMMLVDEERSAAIYQAMGPAVEISGGSAANTMVGVASLGGTAQYLGKVRDDQLGAVFSHDLRATGVRYELTPAPDGPATGSCLILVTPDAQRTMNTYLGASAAFEPNDVQEGVVASGRILYLEGYLFDPPAAQQAFRDAAEIARGAGRAVAITLSDPFCVERHRGAFLDLLDDRIDLVFANEVEACALFECESVDGAVADFEKLGVSAVVTRSELGSLVVSGGEVIEVPAVPVERVVDTTGAGDLFAAGFLFGRAQGLDPRHCASIGSLAASEVIGHLGARPESDLAAMMDAAGLAV